MCRSRVPQAPGRCVKYPVLRRGSMLITSSDSGQLPPWYPSAAWTRPATRERRILALSETLPGARDPVTVSVVPAIVLPALRAWQGSLLAREERSDAVESGFGSRSSSCFAGWSNEGGQNLAVSGSFPDSKLPPTRCCIQGTWRRRFPTRCRISRRPSLGRNPALCCDRAGHEIETDDGDS